MITSKDIAQFMECATINDPGYAVTFNVGNHSDVISLFLLKEDAELFVGSFKDPQNSTYIVEKIQDQEANQ